MNSSPTPDLRRPPDRPVRVLLVDPDRRVRDAIGDSLSLDPGITIVGEADTLDRADHVLLDCDPDVVILEIHLPDGDGLDLCRRHARTDVRPWFLVVTYDPDPRTKTEAMRAGASGYIVKDLTALDLSSAVEATAARRPKADEHAHPAPRAPAPRHRREHELRASLTTVEMAILLLLAEGLTNNQIANRLYFTETTIRNYIARILRKLHLTDRDQAADYATHLRAEERASSNGDRTPNSESR
ncbi:Protein-glutamate methylesterase [Nocardia seriolae]|uniref:Protein-glutamate methylesterase n=1 Tax=Nocardia seriolae TaxID=37332 RepID=A0ABC8AUH5_9NOCA|nr:Protein-glutamate methylesterase [Nocardia seriolae]OJF79790.1 hypothetical protein NS14008_12035 [Nocardia seriolae]